LLALYASEQESKQVHQKLQFHSCIVSEKRSLLISKYRILMYNLVHFGKGSNTAIVQNLIVGIYELGQFKIKYVFVRYNIL